jgi:pantetheine-phosphate adenylyltransferase
MKAVITGSFDPIHEGHIDIISRAAVIFDEVAVAVLDNPKKISSDKEKRVEAVRNAVKNTKNVTVVGTEKDAVKMKPDVIVRGIRNANDLEYERKLSKHYKEFSGLEVMYLIADEKYKDVSSSGIKGVKQI